jgi:hypothetical protein
VGCISSSFTSAFIYFAKSSSLFGPNWGLTSLPFYVMMLATFLQSIQMSTRHHPNQHQAQVTAAVMTQSGSLVWFWFTALAAVSAGVFYFLGYYWANLGRVLTGG